LSEFKTNEKIRQKFKLFFFQVKKIYQFLLPKIKHYEIPMEGKKIGEMLQYLGEQIWRLEEEKC